MRGCGQLKKQWWKQSITYQIYPKSFQDSNGDGIGDIQGIIKRLPYLKELGVDIIWLSPIYKSPMIDGGYDIADYKEIDPMFGTIEDMDELIKRAEEREQKILMDLVVNHTSDQHEWFQKALHEPESKYRNYYIFQEGRDGHPPNNWRSYFGDTAWEEVPGEDNMFYLHAFAKEQPDLNWENPSVREEIITMIDWWLSKGLGGFRIDAILNLKKNIVYGDFEPDGEDGLVYIGDWILNQPGIEVWLKEIDDRTFRKYNSFTVAEADVPDERLSEYIGEDGFFRSVFDFSYTDIDVPRTGEWHKQSGWTVTDLRNAIFKNELLTQKHGWGSRYLENHDQPRSINKYIPAPYIDDKSKKLLATLYLFLRGTPFIYQGQEIGMENIRFDSIEEYDDIASRDQYQRAILSGISPQQALDGLFLRSRDNSRTPMQWADTPHAGFSDAEKTWLPVNQNYTHINVKEENKKSDSVLNYYKEIIRLRKSKEYGELIVNGDFVPVMDMADEVIAYKRVDGEKELLVFINMSDKEQKFSTQRYKEIILQNFSQEQEMGNEIILPSYGAVVMVN